MSILKYKNLGRGTALVLAAGLLVTSLASQALALTPIDLQSGTYINSTYDVCYISNDFETESNKGSGDGTNYMVADSYNAWNVSSGFTYTVNYLASIDFMFTDASQTMQIRNAKNNIGPYFSVTEGSDGNYTFRTQTGSKSYQTLYSSFELNKWYSMELEGRTTVDNAKTCFRLYAYDNGEKSLVATVDTLNLRNMGTKTPDYMLISSGVCIDNEVVYQEYADAVVITEAENRATVSAGSALSFEAVATRNESSEGLTQPNITWSLSNVAAGEEGYFAIDDGQLTINAAASAQTISVCATASTNGNPVGQYEVAVTSLDTSNEPFDAAVVSGSDSIKTGSTSQFKATASKNGTDVTDSLEEGALVWSIYNSDGSRLLGNRNITVENGLVSVDKSVVAQSVRVRVSTADGAIYAEKQIDILKDTKETVINYNACEEKLSSGNALVTAGSVDGSSYYKQVSSDFLGQGTLGTTSTSDAVLLSMDIKFEAAGAGLTTIRRDGGTALYLVNHNGLLACQTGGSAYSDLTDADGSTYALDSESWYHIELMVQSSAPAINIAKYDETGVLGEYKTFTSDNGMKYRSTQGFNRVLVNSNTSIDNFEEVYPEPDVLTVAAEDDVTEIAAGDSASFTVTGTRNGLLIPDLSTTKVNWEVYDSENLYPTEDENVAISGGKLTTYPLAKAETVYIHAISAVDKSVDGYVALTIKESNLIEITGIGVSEDDENHIEKIYASKKGEYDDDIVFLLGLYGNDGVLITSYAKNVYGKNLAVGENTVAVDFEIPESFDKENNEAKVYAWTSLGTEESPEGISGDFTAAYENQTVTLSGLPAFTGKVTLAVISGDVADSALSGDLTGKVFALEQFSDGTAASVKTSDLAAGDYKAVVGATVDGNYQVYVAKFTVQAPECQHPEESVSIINAKDATCTEAGYTGDKYCALCGEILEYGSETSNLQHDYVAEVTKKATYTEEGVTTYTCSRCGDSYTEAIEKLEMPDIVKAIDEVASTISETVSKLIDIFRHFFKRP